MTSDFFSKVPRAKPAKLRSCFWTTPTYAGRVESAVSVGFWGYPPRSCSGECDEPRRIKHTQDACSTKDLNTDLGLVDSRGREWYRGRLVIPEVRVGRSIYLVGRTVPGARGAFGPKYLTLAGAPKPLYGQERVEDHDEVFVVEGPIDYLLLWQWGYPAVATLGSRIKQEHVAFLQGFSNAGVRPRVYLVPHRDDAGRQMWRDCKESFGEHLRTVLVPEEMKDLGDLAEKAAAPAQLFAELVDAAR
jgi:DNA primase